MEEIWKTVKGFEDYQVSNLGKVKSLKFGKEKILKETQNPNGYLSVSLRLNKKTSTKRIHQLVAIAFLNHEPDGHKLVVNHKDFNKLNNNLDNLEIVTPRENTNRKHIKSSSGYIGVSWHKSSKKWLTNIHINGKLKHLGLFKTEVEAYHSRVKFEQENNIINKYL